MITFPLLGTQGRLGNQLWQIASTLGLAHRLETIPSFPSWVYQPYFSIPEEFFSGAREGTPATDLVPHLPPEGIIYLQDYSLWANISEEIHAWFQPSPLAAQKLMEYQEFLNLEPPVMSLHVRRGDNFIEIPQGKADYHPLRPLSYYEDALKLREFESLAVFSDDISWCREHFGPDAYYFEGIARPKEHEPEYQTAPVLDWIDLQLMTFPDYHIISNSTYAWWGAFLSHDPSPIYPAPWFGRKLRNVINADLMFPPQWEKLNHATGS